MKVVIFAGGKGTRLAEETQGLIPKPMVTIGGAPILFRIMQTFVAWGHNEFIIAAGHKYQVIENWVREKNTLLSQNGIKAHTIFTGEDTPTGGRIFQLRSHLPDPFFLTYGDGLGNVNLRALQLAHRLHTNHILTLSAVYPPARFGTLTISNNTVTGFGEKRQVEGGRINGGFMLVDPDIMEYLGPDDRLEYDVLPVLATIGKIGAHLHDGYWQMMDTPRDRAQLEADFQKGQPWLNFDS